MRSGPGGLPAATCPAFETHIRGQPQVRRGGAGQQGGRRQLPLLAPASFRPLGPQACAQAGGGRRAQTAPESPWTWPLGSLPAPRPCSGPPSWRAVQSGEMWRLPRGRASGRLPAASRAQRGLGWGSPARSVPDGQARPAAPSPPSPPRMPRSVPARPKPRALLLTFLSHGHRHGGRRQQKPEREDLGTRHTARASSRGVRGGLGARGKARGGSGAPGAHWQAGDARDRVGSTAARWCREDGASSPRDCALCRRGGAEQTCPTWRPRLRGPAPGCSPPPAGPRGESPPGDGRAGGSKRSSPTPGAAVGAPPLPRCERAAPSPARPAGASSCGSPWGLEGRWAATVTVGKDRWWPRRKTESSFYQRKHDVAP